jgi:5-methylcytosine-specific restriction endonuclease McrA
LKNLNIFTKDEWEQLISSLYKKRCILCLKRYTTIHEIIPKSQLPGAWRSLDNCVPVCHECHTKIHSFGSRKFVEDLRKLQYKRLKDYWIEH